jgi:hypothetical protein
MIRRGQTKRQRRLRRSNLEPNCSALGSFTGARYDAGGDGREQRVRAAFRFTSYRNYRIRLLLCAGKPNWDLEKRLSGCLTGLEWLTAYQPHEAEPAIGRVFETSR